MRQEKSDRYLNLTPSAKAVARQRAALRELMSAQHCFGPVPHLIGTVNRQLRGWANYFRFGYPRGWPSALTPWASLQT